MGVSPRSQKLSITGPSILENRVTDPSIFKNDGSNFGRPKKLCMPVCIDRIATWNIEGMRGDSKIKLVELCLFMKVHGISILCLQETQLFGNEHFMEDGFLVFLSGAVVGSSDTYAGVGFMIAPWAVKAVVGFRAISSRIASLRVNYHFYCSICTT